MAEDPTNNINSPQRNRRASIASETLANLFGRPRDTNNSPPSQMSSGPISQATADAQRRRLSLSILGLSGSPTSPVAPLRGLRNDSISGGSIDETAVDEDGSGPAPNAPFGSLGRRMSFGARALRDVHNGTAASSLPTATAKTNMKSSWGSHGRPGRGLSNDYRNSTFPSRPWSWDTVQLLTLNTGSADFWAENVRNRTERNASVSSASAFQSFHSRAKSISTMEPPARELPPPSKLDRKPDPYQERMLRGELSWD
ncbi:hypothetical protein K470DRAFT_268037 [Piedraia hortae CBS 480.64]|uniref:Uncharacterized protein n=1 Tax=Piedraia hortae CBS 480.64 TaxID=1314780 RepID=A0A6A7C8Q0_9PEZI|nr:hypothetical protein K470DRAFT_268037 [Piedraia hortae CBS 480.64]